MDIIIGAGITGLCYAMFSKGNYMILEKENEIGGYCRTTKRNGYVWDFSGHFFHFQDPNIKKLILGNMDKEQMVNVIKETRIKYKDRFIDYPFQKNIHQLEKGELIDCLFDLFTVAKEEFTNFQEMLYVKFGKSIAEKFLIPYNEKLYACDLNTLDKNAMGRFFPYADKEDIIRNFHASNNASYNDSFIYPKDGAIEYVKAVCTHVDTDRIRYMSDVMRISLQEHKVILKSGEEIKYDRLISTMPFPELLEKTNIDYDKTIYTWNQVLCFNLGFDKKGKDCVNHWLYFPEKKYCFYRTGFYDNIIGQDKMSMYIEIGFSKDDVIKSEEWLDKVIGDLEAAGIKAKDQTLVDYESIIMNPAYVHINKRSIKDVEDKKALLAQYDVYSIGRYGSWTYCSIEDNIKEARQLSLFLNKTTK